MTSNRVPCSVEGCDRPWKARGMCQKHYCAWRKANPDLVTRYGPRNESLESKLRRHVTVNPENGCWEKIGWTTWYGYGQIWWEGRFQYMHRLFYELLVGPIPEGYDVDHLCRNAKCSNPEHMEPVTHRVNLMRADTITRKWTKHKHPECVCDDVTAVECPYHGRLKEVG